MAGERSNSQTTIEELIAEVKQLREDLDFHNHNGINSKSLDDVQMRNVSILGNLTTGELNIPNRKNPLVSISRTGVLSILQGIITGGTIQTAASGARVVMVSNAIDIYDANGVIGKINGGAGQGVFVANINDATDNRGLLVIANKTDGTVQAVEIATKGNQRGLYIHNDTDNLVTDYLLGVDISSAHADRVALAAGVRFRNLSKGSCLQASSGNNATGPSFYSQHSTIADSYGWHLLFDHNSNDNSAVYIDKTSTGAGYIFEGTQGAVVSTNFKRGLKLAGWSLWISDGTTPNGNLSGTTGDICVNADSGKTYYCTGTTNWTAV